MLRSNNCRVARSGGVPTTPVGSQQQSCRQTWSANATTSAQEKVEPLWENVDRYWNNFGLSEELLEYIAENVDTLESKSSTCLDNCFRQDVIQSDINPLVFTKLLKHLHLDDFDIPLENVQEENVKTMIRSHSFAFSVERYDELSACYPALCETFILENKDEFLSVMPTISLREETFENLFLSKEVDNNFKEKIINQYGADLMTKVIADKICLAHLSIRKEVFYVACELLDKNRKKMLMIGYMDILLAQDFENCFKEIGEPYQELSDRSRRHNVTIPDSEEHRKLVKRLRKIDYITSYSCNECIKEYDRSLKKHVEIPAILCRVKATSTN